MAIKSTKVVINGHKIAINTYLVVRNGINLDWQTGIRNGKKWYIVHFHLEHSVCITLQCMRQLILANRSGQTDM